MTAPVVDLLLSRQSGGHQLGRCHSGPGNRRRCRRPDALTIDGTPVVVDSFGTASFRSATPGLFDIVATAFDEAGNETTASVTLRVIDPADTLGPVIDITGPSPNSEVTTLTDIIGSVTDDNLEFFTVEFGRADLVDINDPTAFDPDYVTIATGTADVTNALLGTFDPTLLMNDSYIIRVFAQDLSGNVSAQTLPISIDGQLKFGQFTLNQTDLAVSVAGTPIELTRTYDTRQSGEQGDFGFGWNLAIQDAQIRETIPVNPLEKDGLILAATPFKAGTRVYLTNPEGKRVGFTFDPEPQFSLFGGGSFSPRFVPDPGVYDTLDVGSIPLRLVNGAFYSGFFGNPFNPSAYRLTTRDGVVYEYGQFSGLQNVIDRNGNRLEFREDGIFSSTGESVRFVRDPAGRISQVIDPAGRSLTYEYDANGDLTRFTDQAGLLTQYTYLTAPAHFMETAVDPNGNTVFELQYDADGRLTRSTDAGGATIQNTYNPGQLSETITDPLGNEITTRFDSRGNLLSFTDALGESVSFTYDASDNIITATDGNGNVVTRTIDTRGNLTSLKDPLGNSFVLTYGEDNQVTSIMDSAGNVSRSRYDEAGNLIQYVNAAGVVSSYQYDAQGRPTSYTDNNGNSTQYVYGSGPRPEEVIHADGTRERYEYNYLGQVTRAVDENGFATLYTYDAIGRPTSVENALGQTTTYTYDGRYLSSRTDALGRITRYVFDEKGRRTAVTDAAGNTTQFGYDDNNQLVTVTDPLGGITTTDYRADGEVESVVDALGNTVRYEYDSVGNVTAVIDPRGNRTEYQYDAMGRLLETMDSLGGTTSYTYDAAGNLLTAMQANGATVTYVYDSLNRLVSATDPLGGRFEYTYDANGNLRTFTDANDHVSNLFYDSRDRVTRIVDPAGETLHFTYDAAGNIETAIDPADQTTSYVYDALDRLIRVTDPIGNTTAYTYDAVGNLESLTDPTARTTTYSYDSLYRLTAVTDAAGERTQFGYDALGRRTSVTDALDQKTTFAYDAIGRLTTETDPLGLSTSFAYDANGNRIRVTDRNDRVTEFNYDALNRVVEERWLDNASSVLRQVTFVYDAVGNLLAASDPDSVLTFTYDLLSRVSTADVTGTPRLPDIVLTYTYDAVGNLLNTHDDSGVQVTSLYDERDLLINRVWQGGGIDPASVDVDYNARRERTHVTRYSDASGLAAIGSSIYDYDAAGRLTDIQHQDELDQVFVDYDYLFDEAGRLVNEAHHGASVAYEYDALGQLTAADYSSGASVADQTFQYDENGNRTDPGFVVAANNRIESDGTYNYAYDNEGNLIRRTQIGSGDYTEFTWDYRNRLTQVEQFDSTGTSQSFATYTYDALNRRIRKDVDGIVTATVYSFDAAWADFDDAKNVTARYLPSGQVDEFFARWRPGEGTAWYLTDRLGTVRDIADETGTTVDHIDYDSFGNVADESNPAFGDRFKFTGREYDAETGLYYYRARYYDPTLGRFISEDPLGFSGGDANLQRYVANDPLNAVDPTGMQAIASYGGALAANQAVAQAAIFYGKDVPFRFQIQCQGANCVVSGGPSGLGDLSKVPDFDLGGGISVGGSGVSISDGFGEKLTVGAGGITASGGETSVGINGDGVTFRAPGTQTTVGPGGASGSGGGASYTSNGAGGPFFKVGPFHYGQPVKTGSTALPAQPSDGEFDFLVESVAKSSNIIISANTAIFAGVATELNIIAQAAAADDATRLVQANFEKSVLSGDFKATVQARGFARLPGRRPGISSGASGPAGPNAGPGGGTAGGGSGPAGGGGGAGGPGGGSGSGSNFSGSVIPLNSRSYLRRPFLMFIDPRQFDAFSQLIVDPFNNISVVVE
ncbi:MAG: RHS repeat-associated core domain-containing protein [Planctomycetaceae bacterium]